MRYVSLEEQIIKDAARGSGFAVSTGGGEEGKSQEERREGNKREDQSKFNPSFSLLYITFTLLPVV